MTNARTRIERTGKPHNYGIGMEKSDRKSSFRSVILPVLLILAVALAIAGTAVLVHVLEKNRELDAEQTAFVEKLRLSAGSYDDKTIVLQKTNKYAAEKLANQFNAKLRMANNDTFAVLYLPDESTILDICSDPANKELIADISPDYLAHIADSETAEEAEPEEYEEVLHLPKAPESVIEDEFYFMQSYLNYIGLGDTWENARGNGITVAVIDTGIDTDHPEFARRISNRSYNATYDKVVEDWDNDWSLIEDNAGHGTSVAGVIAAAMDGKGTVGIAPEVNLIIIKAECNEFGEFYRASDLLFGLYYAIECDVDVVNMSFTTKLDFSDAVILADDSDILCVASAGNDGVAGLQSPASYDEVVAVGALDSESWDLAKYSNYAEKMVVAPGTVFTTAIGGGYRVISGTSFSAPIVSASLALLLYRRLTNPCYRPYMISTFHGRNMTGHESDYLPVHS